MRMAVENGVTLHKDKRIAIFSAYGPELDLLIAKTTHQMTLSINGRSVILGKLNGHNVILTKTGVSMVNSAMATEAILRTFNVEKVLFSGVAGGIDPTHNIGDVVVPAKWSDYLEGYLAQGSNGNYPEPDVNNGIYTPANLISKPVNNGPFYPESVNLANEMNLGTNVDKEVATTWMQADPKLLKVASGLNVQLSNCGVDAFTGATHCLTNAPKLVVGGNGVSGSSFVDNADFRSYIFETWQAACVDMESAAMAHVATVHNVPFIVFRSLSDLAGGSKQSNELGLFLGLAANNAANVLLAFLDAMQ
ncbi:mta/sah nucleosidase [Chytriomyces sp. MP71]|nr:mta/sah nucleosidase [Chytriomyces sp. MP71]